MKKLLTLVLVSLFFCTFSVAEDRRSVRIGLVADYVDADLVAFSTQVVKSEIQKTLGSSYDIKLDKADILLSRTPEERLNNYRKLTKNCDVIFLYGPLAVKNLLDGLKKFTKPTFGIGVFDTELQGIPYTEKGTSGVKNFSYILTKNSIDEDLKKFKEMYDYKKLTVVYDSSTDPVINRKITTTKFARLADKYKAVFNYAGFDGNVEALRQQLRKEKPDSVYLVIPIVYNAEEIRKIADMFIEEKLPSFAFNNDTVALGILGSYGSRKDLKITVVRKLAIMIDEVYGGADPSGMQVGIHDQEEMFLNINTADKINYSPPFSILFSVEVIGEPAGDKKLYSAEEIVAIALEKNLDIKISKKDVELAEQDVKEAGSRYLPEISSSVTGTLIDKDSTNGAAGRAQRSLSNRTTLNQLIFSDEVIAGRKIQKYLRSAKEFNRMSDVNDVILNALQGYLGVLKAKTGVIIQEENYSSSRKNLDIAELRVRLGSTDKSEVYRWRSEVASSRQSVIEAHISLELAKIQLNSLLDDSLGHPNKFDIKDISLYGEFFKKTSGILGMEGIKTPEDLELLSGYLIEKASELHPQELAIRANKLAADKQIKMNRKKYWLPTVSLVGQLDNSLSKGGAGSAAPAGVNLPDTTWSLSVNISQPIFEGNRRKINLSRSILQKKQLIYQEKRLRNSISTNIKANVMNLAGASTNIIFSEESSKNAEKNYELVQENYKQGTVSIVQLIDAQKASLNAKQGYAVSLYNFLDNMFKLEHGVGFFFMYAPGSDENKRDFDGKFRAYKKRVGR